MCNVNDQGTTEGAGPIYLEKVSPRLPLFTPNKPEVWFIIAEAQFSLAGINQQGTKFKHLLGQLDPSTVENLLDIAASETFTNKYDLAKARLLKVYADSEEKKINKLLREVEMGDEKPSQFLLRLEVLGNGKVPENIIKNVWMDRMPKNIQTILAITEGSLQKLAEIADKLWELNSNYNISPVERKTETSPANLEIKKLNEKINMLEEKINQLLETNNNNRSRSPSPYKRSKSPSRFKNTGKFCFYHFKFKENAKKCTPPCQWRAGNEKRQRD